MENDAGFFVPPTHGYSYLPFNAATLGRLYRNDPELTNLRFRAWFEGADQIIADSKFLTSVLIDGKESSMSKNDDWCGDACRGLVRNRSIRSFCMSIPSHRPCRGWFRALSRFFERNSKLCHIQLQGSFFGIRGPLPPNNGFDDYCIALLSTALIRNATLTRLDLFGDFNLTAKGWETFAAALSHPDCYLECITLGNSGKFGDEDISCLGEALAVNGRLITLVFIRQRSITSSGWRGFARCFNNPNSALVNLILFECNIDADGATEIVSALSENARLEELSMTNNNHLREKDWSDLSRVLCDTTSIERTFSSNHTLRKLHAKRWLNEGVESDEDEENWSEEDYDSLIVDGRIKDDIERSFWMNYNANKAEVARFKILKHHFPRGDIVGDVFASMAESTLPFAIEWIGRRSSGSKYQIIKNLEETVMFNFVRNHPELFDIRNKSAVVTNRKAAAKKRKRQPMHG